MAVAVGMEASREGGDAMVCDVVAASPLPAGVCGGAAFDPLAVGSGVSSSLSLDCS